MTQSNKEYLIASYEIDVGKYVSESLERMKRGFNVKRRAVRLWLIMNYLDLISKHSVFMKELNVLEDEEMNNIVAHMNQLLNTNYNLYF